MATVQNLIGKKSVPPFRKQQFAVVLQSRCSKKLCNIHKKTPVFQSFKRTTLLKNDSSKVVFL